MEDLQDKIIELMDLFDEGEVTTADQIKRPEKALEREAIIDFMKRNPMAGGGEVVIGKPGGLVQPETKFYAIKKTIKGTGDNAGKFTTYIGPRNNQTMYVGSKDYIDKIRTLNQEKKYIGSNKEKKDIKKNIAVENKKAIKKNFKDNLGINVEIGKNNLISGKGLTDELKKKISNAQTAYRKKNPGQAGLANEGFWKYYSNIDKNKEAAATAAAEKEAAKIKAKDPNFIKQLDRPLKKSEIVILNKSYQNIFKEEYARLLNEGELFSKTDLARAVINRVTEENPTIDLQKGIGLDKIPGGGNEESKTIFDNINKLFTTKQKTNFTTNTNALAYTKNQDRLLQALLAGNNDFDDLMNELGFNEGRLKGNVNKLMKNLAQTEKSKQPLFFKKYNQKELEQARNLIYESPTLESVYQRTIVQSVLQSTKLGSPERKQALQKLKEFNQFKKVLQDNGISGKIISLDHAASYRAIKNGNLKNFLAVTPIISDINAIKSTFDRRSQLNLRRMQDAIEAGDNATYKKFLKNQTELEGIWKTMTGDQSSLGKIRVQPGGKAKGVTKIFDFGATSILDRDKDLINELADNLKIRQNIVNASTPENFQEVSRIMFEGSAAQRPKKSALPESFKNLNKPEMFKTEKKINDLILNYAATVTDKCAVDLKAGGGRIGYNLGSEACLKIGKEALDNGLTNGFKNKQQVNLAETILKGGAGLKSAFALRNIFGPAAVAATIGFEGGLIGYDMLTSGKTLREAFGDNLLNYALGKDYQIDPQKELFKRFKGLGYNNQQLGSIKKSLDTMNTINTGTKLAMDVGQQQEALQKSRGQTEEFMIPDDQMMADTAGQRAEQKLKDTKNQLAEFNRDLVRSGQADALNKYIESGDYAKGFDLFEQAQKAATVEQMQSPGPEFMGSVFPKFEERRTQTISENLPFGGVNPAFNIPGARDATFIPGKTVGGLYGLAEGGVASGPPPKSGPTPHGLPSLMKRGMKI